MRIVSIMTSRGNASRKVAFEEAAGSVGDGGVELADEGRN